jgi:hypothetical protein
VRVKVYHVTPKSSARFWQVADYSKGKRKLLSFSDHDAAVRRAGTIARLMAAGESHAARGTGRDWASCGRSVELIAHREARGALARYVQDLRHRLGRFADANPTGRCQQ